MAIQTLTLGHSPDPDDAFMFYALAREKIDTGNLRFMHVVEDIESLNRRAEKAELDVTALSFHAYAYVADRYRLLRCGASMGERYGPMVVAREALSWESLSSCRIAVPGEWTSAFLLLRLCIGAFKHGVVPFDQIMEQVAQGKYEAGLLIHEGQLTYQERGLQKILDLGEWWDDETGLPVPLGVNAVRRDLGEDVSRQVADILRQSIRYGLEHRAKAVEYSLAFARGMGADLADRFVGMYVNETTLDFGERGEKAVSEMLTRACLAGLLPSVPRLDVLS